MASLKEKVVLITGAGDEKGIGAATALHMVQFGTRLVLTGRDEARLQRVGQLCMEAGLAEGRLLLVVADVTKDSDLERLVEKTVSTFQQIDVLVNNAATITYHSTMDTTMTPFDYVMNTNIRVNNAATITYHSTMDTTMTEFDTVMNTNIRAPFCLSKLCLPHLIKTKGNIVNISSVSGQRAYSGEASYCISKAALDHFSRILAMEVAHHGVRVNTVSPGVIWTSIQKKGGMSEEAYEQYMVRQHDTHPLGRPGDPLEVAKAITFLASDDASFTTGHMLMFMESQHKSHPLGRPGDPLEVAKAITFLASDDASFTTGHVMNVDGGRHAHLFM